MYEQYNIILWLYLDNSEWKQKLDNERKRTKKLERSIRKLRAEIEAVDQVAPAKKKSKKSESFACILIELVGLTVPRHGVESFTCILIELVGLTVPRHGVESSVGGEQQQQRDAKSSVAKSESDHVSTLCMPEPKTKEKLTNNYFLLPD